MNKTHQRPTSVDGNARNRKRTEQTDARGQFAKGHAKPNDGGLASSNPTVLSGDGDGTFEGDPHVDKAVPERNKP